MDHRDGEQQEKRYENMPITDRIEVFDQFVNAGMRQAEIGHLGNPHDIAFTHTNVISRLCGVSASIIGVPQIKNQALVEA